MTLFIVFLVMLVTLPTVFITYALIVKKEEKEPFSFRSYFSYEFFPKDKKNTHYLILRIIEGFAFSVNVLPGLYGLLSLHQWDLNSALLFIALFLAGLTFGVGQYLLSVIDLSFAKQHLSLFFATDASLILFAGMGGFYFLAVYRNLNELPILILAILLFLVLLFSVAFVLNPKIKDWGKMEKQENEDGSVSYRRPKRFVLPYSEWGLALLSILSSVIMLIGLFFISIK